MVSGLDGQRSWRRLASVNAGALLLVTALVVCIAAALPSIPAAAFPVVLSVALALLLWCAASAAQRSAATTARVWAGWAGVVSLLGVLAWSNLLGWGGALSTTLLVALALNTVIAALFRSAVHLAVVQLGAILWAAIAFLYGIPAVPLAVFGIIGLWWIGTIGASRCLIATTTIVLPISGALLIHPLTHSGLTIDGADLATLVGCATACSLLGAAVSRNTPDPRVWRTMRTTIVTVFIVQSLLGSVPAVARLFAPMDPLPGLLIGLCLILCTASFAALRPVRHGTVRVLAFAGLAWIVIAAGAVLPDWLAALVAPTVLIVVLWRISLRVGADTRTGMVAVFGAAGLGVWTAILVGAEFGAFPAAGALAFVAVVIVAVTMHPSPVPPRGTTTGAEVGS